MGPRAQEVVDLIKSRPGISRGAIAEALNMTLRGVEDHTYRLKVAGVIHAGSRGRYAGWHAGAAPKSEPVAANDLMAAWYGRAA